MDIIETIKHILGPLMLKIQCTKCDFEFEKEEIPSRCPYCAGEGTLGDLKTAQELLNEDIWSVRIALSRTAKNYQVHVLFRL